MRGIPCGSTQVSCSHLWAGRGCARSSVNLTEDSRPISNWLCTSPALDEISLHGSRAERQRLTARCHAGVGRALLVATLEGLACQLARQAIHFRMSQIKLRASKQEIYGNMETCEWHYCTISRTL